MIAKRTTLVSLVVLGVNPPNYSKFKRVNIHFSHYLIYHSRTIKIIFIFKDWNFCPVIMPSKYGSGKNS